MSSVKYIFLTSVTTLFLAILAYFKLSDFILNQIQNRIKLDPSSPMYKIWKDVPINIYHKIFFFNITNQYEINKYNAKPILKEVGPFVYDVRMFKSSINIDDEKDKISYFENHSWSFNKELSAYSENTLITTVNTPLITSYDTTDQIPFISIFYPQFTKNSIFIQKTVKELTFKGYKDFLIATMPLFKKDLPSMNGKFSYLGNKNNTAETRYTIFTGKQSPEKFGLIDAINNEKLLPFLSEPCNSLNDTYTSEVIPYPLKYFKPEFSIYNDFFGRKLNLIYNQTVKTYESIQAYRYTFDPNNFKNAFEYPPNICYAKKKANKKLKSNTSSNSFSNFDNLTENNNLESLNNLPVEALVASNNPPINSLFNRPRLFSNINMKSRQEQPDSLLGLTLLNRARNLSLLNLILRDNAENRNLNRTFANRNNLQFNNLIGNVLSNGIKRLINLRNQNIERRSNNLNNLNNPNINQAESSLFKRRFRLKRLADVEKLRRKTRDIINSTNSANSTDSYDSTDVTDSSDSPDSIDLIDSNKSYIPDNFDEFIEMLPSGAFDFKRMSFGAPIVLSQPHFLNADSYYTKNINGMKPDASKHDFYIDIDPIGGTSIKTAIRMQVNINMHKSDFVFRDSNHTIIPIFWQEFYFELPDEHQTFLRFSNIMVNSGAKYVFIFLFILSICLQIVVLFKCLTSNLNISNKSKLSKPKKNVFHSPFYLNNLENRKSSTPYIGPKVTYKSIEK